MGEGLQWDDVIDALFGQGIDTVEQAFKFIDADGSGTISHEELLAAVQTLELKGTTEELPRQPLLLESGKDCTSTEALRSRVHTFLARRGGPTTTAASARSESASSPDADPRAALQVPARSATASTGGKP